MKKIYVILLAVFITLPMFAGDAKLRIAVFDPTSSRASIDDGTKIAIREIISSTIVNAGNYDIVERSLLEKVMQEQQFSNSGVVDDGDATEIGKLAGANKIVLSVVDDKVINVYIDKESFGGGTYNNGFTLRINKNFLKNKKNGIHDLVIDGLKMEFDENRENYYEFQSFQKKGAWKDLSLKAKRLIR